MSHTLAPSAGGTNKDQGISKVLNALVVIDGYTAESIFSCFVSFFSTYYLINDVVIQGGAVG